MQTDTGAIVDSIVPGMWNLYYALKQRGLDGKIKVTSPQQPGFLSTPYPPSHAQAAGAFGAKWKKLLDFLDKTGTDTVRTQNRHRTGAARLAVRMPQGGCADTAQCDRCPLPVGSQWQPVHGYKSAGACSDGRVPDR